MEELNKNEVIEEAETVEIEEAISEEVEQAVTESSEEVLSGLTEKQRRRRMIWDKITTGILIALLASPIAILAYILIWFMTK